MSTALTSEGQDLVFRHLFNDTTTTFPAGSWLSLHSAQPTTAGNSQVSGTRVAVSWTYDATNLWYSNSAPVVLGVGFSTTISWVALWHSSGTGNVWFEGLLASPLVMLASGSVIVPAGTLRVYATPPDGTHKGGVADKGAELILGHFLGVASWSGSGYAPRCHSADPTRTGNVGVSYTHSSGSGASMGAPFGNLWRGDDVVPVANTTRYWSLTSSSGALIYGDAGSGQRAWYHPSSGIGDNGIDVSGVADHVDSGITYNSLRFSLDVLAGVVAGDVNSGVLTAAGVGGLAVTLSLKAPVTTFSGAGTFLVSVGSTTQARLNLSCAMALQIGDSAPGVGFAWESLLYPSTASIQILGNG